jgi:hypothetical protein
MKKRYGKRMKKHWSGTHKRVRMTGGSRRPSRVPTHATFYKDGHEAVVEIVAGRKPVVLSGNSVITGAHIDAAWRPGLGASSVIANLRSLILSPP